MNIPAMTAVLTSTKKLSNRERAKNLYEGKKFYVINPDGTLEAREDILYAVDRRSYFRKLLGKIKGEKTYKFLQVMDGRPVQAFYGDEIVVVKDGKQVA